MNKKHNKRKIIALTLSIALVIVMTAMLAACNETGGQGAMKVITFDFNDGSGNTFENVLNIKESISYTPPKREGYDFIGWTFDKEGKSAFDASMVETASLTLYAQWKIKTYAVYFFLYEGEDPISSQTVAYGGSAAKPSESVIAQSIKSGDVFVEWIERFDNVKSDTYVYAKTSKIECSVKFMDGENEIKSAKGTFGDKITLPSDNENPTKNGYKFAGWFDEKGNQATSETTFSGDKTYYAKWTIDDPQQPTLSKDFEITYGESANLTASISEKIEGITYTYEWFENGVSIAKGESVSIDKLGAGEHVIRCSVTASDGTQTSDATSAFVTVTVQKATLSATIAAINLTYGDILPILSVQFAGFKYDDDQSAIDISALQWDTAYTQTSDVGEYTISASGFASANYDVTFENGKIVVGKKAVTAKSALAFDKKYDGSTLAKAFGNDAFDGIIDGHVLSLNLATTASNVGEYTYLGGTITSKLKIVDADGQNVAGNYNVTFDATATILLATINESDYTVPSAEDNTFVYDTQNHGNGVKSDRFDVLYSLDEKGVYTANAPHFADAGVYTVYYKVSHDNYETVNGSYVVTVNKAKLTVTVDNQSAVYGSDFDFDESAYSVDGKDYNVAKYTLSCAYNVGDNAGEYPIVLTIANDKNFDITVNDGVLTVAKAALSVSISPLSVTYGEQLGLDVASVATATGLFAGDSLADVITLATDYAADNNHGVNGEYYVYCALKDDNQNYVLTTEKAKVTVEKRTIRVEIDNMSVVYGETLGEYAYTLTEGSIVDGDVLSDIVICESDYSCTSGNYTPVGSTTITARSGNDNYDLIVFHGEIKITKRPVTVTLDANGIPYNRTFAEYLAQTAPINIFVSGETQWDGPRGFMSSEYSSATKNACLSFKLVRGQYGDNADEEYKPGMVGSFELIGEYVNDEFLQNYDVTVVNAKVDVAALNYGVAINKKYAYKDGMAASFDIADALKTVLREGDVIEGTISTKSCEVGTYKLGESNANEFDNLFEIKNFKVTNEYGDVTSAYTFEPYYCDITIEIAEISIPHSVQSLTTFTYDGEAHSVAVKAEDSEVIVNYSLDNENWTSDVPSFVDVDASGNGYTVYYKLTKSDESVVNPVEYTGSYVIKIAKRRMQIVCHDQYATYGDPFELDLTAYEIINAVDKDLENIHITLYAYNSETKEDYKAGDHVGNYVYIKDKELSYPEGNYYCDVTSGKLHVEQKEVHVKGHETTYTVVYGEEISAEYAYDVVDSSGNTVDGAKGLIKFTNVYEPGCPAGMTYGVNAEAIAVDYYVNYTVKDCDISVTVLPRPLTVKVKGASFVYGQEIALKFEIVDGTLFDKDTLDAQYDLTDTNVGEYTVSASFDSYNASNKNYDVTVQSGVVAITKATLTVTLSKTQTITYGDDMPTYTATTSGFAYADDESVIGGTLAIECAYTENKAAGTFDVTASGYTSGNYEIVYVKSSLIVKKATLTLTVKPHDAITYGDDVPTDFAYVAEGFVNGDDESILAGKVSFETQYEKGADASDTKYTFNAACDNLDNYNVVLGNAQTLVVNKANHTEAEVKETLAQINLSGTYKYGETLGAYSLAGTGFDWVDTNTLVTCDKNDVGYAVRYCKNKTNYNVFDDGNTYIKINLTKADAVFEYDGEFGAIYTGSAIDFAAIMKGTASPEGVVTANRVDHVSGWNPTFTYILVEPVGATQMIDGGIYKVRVSASETTNYKAAHCDVVFNVYAAQLDSAYMTVENALATAKSGDTVYLVGNAFLSKNVSVNSGVTLILGLKTANYTKTIGKVDTSAEYAASGLGDYAWKTLASDYALTIKGGVTLTISGGNVLVAGLLGHASTRFEGHTSGAYSKIVNDGNIVMNGGAFDVRGLVSGSGQAIFNTGSVYSPFVVRDFKGGTYTVNKAWKNKAFSSKGKVAPFAEYEMPNIQCDSRYYSGATLTGYADLYAGSQHNTTNVNAISSSGILRIASGGYIDKKYDASTEKTTLTLVGNITLGSLEIKISVKVVVTINETVKMSETYFPIPWTYNINIGDGKTASTLTASNDYKVMPGAVITVKKNAKLTSTGELIVYNGWTDTNTIQKYPESKGTDGTLIIDGGTFEATTFGGIVQGTGNGGTAKVTKTMSVTAYEHDNNDRLEVTKEATLADGTKMVKGTTYTL